MLSNAKPYVQMEIPGNPLPLTEDACITQSRFPSHLHSASIILTPIAKILEFWSLQEQ